MNASLEPHQSQSFVLISRCGGHMISHTCALRHGNAEGNHLSRRALQAQRESLMRSLLTPALFSHTFTLISVLFGGLGHLPGVSALINRGHGRERRGSYSPNLICWLNYSSSPSHFLASVARWTGVGRERRRCEPADMKHYTDGYLAAPPTCCR